MPIEDLLRTHADADADADAAADACVQELFELLRRRAGDKQGVPPALKSRLGDEIRTSGAGEFARELRRSADAVDAFFAWLAQRQEEWLRERPAYGRPRDLAAALARWALDEDILGVRANLAVAALEPPVLAAVVGALVPLPAGASALRVAQLRAPGGDRGALGRPDVLLAGEGALVVLALKSRGTKAKRKLAADELLAYANLVAAAAPCPVQLLVVGPAGVRNLFGKHLAGHAGNRFDVAPGSDEEREPLRVDGTATFDELVRAAAEPKNHEDDRLRALLEAARTYGGDLAARLDALVIHRATYHDFVRLLGPHRTAGTPLPEHVLARFERLAALANPRS
jgi:hypothetical protein